MKVRRAASDRNENGWTSPLKFSSCLTREKRAGGGHLLDTIPDSQTSRFKWCIFQMAVTTAALVLAGCASSPEIRQGLATTTPLTQNRDHAIYDWPTRHAAVIEFYRTHRPEIVLIGDSIIHFLAASR